MLRFVATLILLTAALVSSAFACPDIDGAVDLRCDGKVLVVTFGDSITRGYLDPAGLGYPGRLAKLMKHIDVANLGFVGENTSEGRVRAMRELDNFPDADYIIIMEGTNDFYDESPSVTEAKANLLSMISSAKKTGAKVLVGNVTATTRGFQRGWVSDINSAIQSFVNINFNALGTTIVGFDGLHPSGEGYQKMASLVRAHIRRLAKKIRPKDTDKDGLYDYEEKRLKTKGKIKDSDGDGILDGTEVWKYKSNPKKLDSDGDGIQDGVEVKQFKTNPAKSDTDADGLSDPHELNVSHTNPLLADSGSDLVTLSGNLDALAETRFGAPAAIGAAPIVVVGTTTFEALATPAHATISFNFLDNKYQPHAVAIYLYRSLLEDEWFGVAVGNGADIPGGIAGLPYPLITGTFVFGSNGALVSSTFGDFNFPAGFKNGAIAQAMSVAVTSLTQFDSPSTATAVAQ